MSFAILKANGSKKKKLSWNTIEIAEVISILRDSLHSAVNACLISLRNNLKSSFSLC